jgi:hypothetical protein
VYPDSAGIRSSLRSSALYDCLSVSMLMIYKRLKTEMLNIKPAQKALTIRFDTFRQFSALKVLSK